MTDRLSCPGCARLFAGQAALSQHRRATHDSPAWVRSKRPPGAPACPRCGAPAALSAGRFGLKAECCGLWSWNLKPLVDGGTHAARIRAHAALDALWKAGAVPRGECYRRLRAAMGLSEAECHIARMSAAQARRVIEIVRSGALGAA